MSQNKSCTGCKNEHLPCGHTGWDAARCADWGCWQPKSNGGKIEEINKVMESAVKNGIGVSVNGKMIDHKQFYKEKPKEQNKQDTEDWEVVHDMILDIKCYDDEMDLDQLEIVSKKIACLISEREKMAVLKYDKEVFLNIANNNKIYVSTPHSIRLRREKALLDKGIEVKNKTSLERDVKYNCWADKKKPCLKDKK